MNQNCGILLHRLLRCHDPKEKQQLAEAFVAFWRYQNGEYEYAVTQNAFHNYIKFADILQRAKQLPKRSPEEIKAGRSEVLTYEEQKEKLKDTRLGGILGLCN